MSIFVFFKIEMIRALLANDLAKQKLGELTYRTINVGGVNLTLHFDKGGCSAKIERKNQLTPEAWEMVDYVSIRDEVSDPAMIKQMASGEYYPEGAKATVRLGMVGEEPSYPTADIEVIGRTWEAAYDLHRAILFGRKPDKPYVQQPK